MTRRVKLALVVALAAGAAYWVYRLSRRDGSNPLNYADGTFEGY